MFDISKLVIAMNIHHGVRGYTLTLDGYNDTPSVTKAWLQEHEMELCFLANDLLMGDSYCEVKSVSIMVWAKDGSMIFRSDGRITIPATKVADDVHLNVF